jgi:PAS domain S-box-containing protein
VKPPDMDPKTTLLEPGSAAVRLAAGSGNGSLKAGADLKANILVVDDRADKLLALEAVLSGLGQNLVQVRSGKEALRQLLKQDFAVILLDVSMPTMDGFETAALIRQRPRSEHTPIIFITSIGNSENHISRGYSLGAVDYLLTPIVPEVLRAKVSVFVELHRQTELGKIQAEQLRRFEESRHRRELAEVSDRLEAETRRNRFFTLALDMLGIADFSGRLLQLNSSWEKVLGYREEELRAVSGLELVHPNDRASMLEQFEVLRRGGTAEHLEGRYRHKDGTYRWLLWSAVPFQAENLIYIFARDITPRKEAEAEVALLNKQLEQRLDALTAINGELEAFNYSIAHDLRTPLRSMSGFAKALLEDESTNLTPLGLEYATRIARSANYMDSLLLDMLAYSRLAGAEIAPEVFSLDEPVSELLTLVEREVRDRKVTIDVESPLGTVFAHLPTFKQILTNLISNSIKFLAPDRSPRVRVFTTPQGQYIRLWVEDNGIGIAREHHEKIFGLFQRLHDNQTYPGTGIGLALVRKGVERMGGRVGVESDLGQGSRFWVDLPAPPTVDDGNQDSAR